MSTGDADAPLSREQVLDELEGLAEVEHSLCVEYPLVYCALGQGLLPENPDATAGRVNQAAHAAMGLAQREMRHLHRVNQALVVGGRAPALGRVSSVGGGSTPDVPLGSPTVADLERVVDRERGIASAVDARFARLRLVVEARDPVLEGELFEHVSDVVGGGTSHSGSLDAFEEPLEGLSPSAFLHATCREPAHELERRLLALSDQQYATIVATVRVWFTREDAIHSDLFIPAMAAMDVLDAINGLLVERGVLPAFTAPR